MAANAEKGDDVNKRCLPRHRRWKSNLSKGGYVNDSAEKRLNVTKKRKIMNICFCFVKLIFKSFIKHLILYAKISLFAKQIVVLFF